MATPTNEELEDEIDELRQKVDGAADYYALEDLKEEHAGTRLELEIRISELSSLQARVADLEDIIEQAGFSLTG